MLLVLRPDIRSLRQVRLLLLTAASTLIFAALQPAEYGEAFAEEAAATIKLNVIEVKGRGGERGDGPVQGYVARQSLTATKTDTPIERTPQSIAVVTKDQMQDQSVQSVAEALRYTPGVFTEYRGASNLRDEVFARGFYYIPRYLDGMFLSGELSYAQINPYLLERVELISGPSSVLYGQANPGGILNMVSKKPTDGPLREIEVSAGTNKHVSASIDISDKVPGSDALSYRIVATGLSTDLQENYTKKRGYAIAPSLTWSPDADTKLTVLGGYQNEPHAGFRNFLDAAGTLTSIEGYGYVPRDFFVSDPNYEHFSREQAWIGAELEQTLNDTFTFRQRARYYEMNMSHRSLIWGSATADPVTGYATTITRSASGGTDKWKQFTSDSQLEAKFDTGAFEHTMLAGVDVRYRVRDYRWGRASVPSISLTDPQYGGFDYDSVELVTNSLEHLTARQTGIYLQDQVQIGGLNLLAGLRYDWASTEIDDRLNGNDQSYDDKALTWRVGALYSFDNGIAPYISYSTSFDPALYSPLAGEPAFDPTTASQLEVGVKYAPEGSNILLTAAYYDLKQNDVVSGAWDSTLGQTVYSQIGKIHNHGIELSARGDVTANLSLIASYAYTRSKIEESVTASEVNMTPARIPEHQAALWGTYDFVGTHLEGLKVGAGVRYIGKSWGNNANSFEVPSVMLVDAMVSYDFGALKTELEGLSLQVNAKNLGDKNYVASCANAYACFYGEGRSLIATLKKAW
ncbi:TonB-dependent siderophore receptor [Brucella pituitosa]|uniref:TonB-dependent siderophore receptor n=1 Tax=Brucella pituitosa TaxID=571256 RepID=UPI003F4ACE8B